MCISIDNRGSNFTKGSIKNDTLRSYANILAKDAMNIRANLLHMSAIMATIAAQRDDGILAEFDDSIVKFAEERLGLKKSQTYSMVQVGATFLDSAGKSLLTQKGGRWSNTQFMALLPMAGTGKDKRDAKQTLEACEELVNNGIIKPSMSVAEIKEVVKEHRPDAEAKRVRAAKAEAKKKAEEEAKEKAEAKIHGKLIGKIEFFQFEDGTIHCAINGEVSKLNDSNIYAINELIMKSANYSK